MWSTQFVLLLLASVISPALAGIQELWWNITYVENANPDGLADRRVIGVNNTWPPPPLDVNTTDSLLIHMTNSLDVATSLHHHGMFFNNMSFMDGPVGVSECGTPPGGTFDYVVPINSSGQWGTYWVHSHKGSQYVDGLRAPLVLHPPTEVYSYDEEFTIILSDWYHTEAPILLESFINIANPGGAEPIPDSALIYFAQNASYLGPISGTDPSPTTAAVGFNENSTLPFEAGKTYRLRIVNVSAFAMFYFWIDGHDMRIVEVEGTDTEEYPIDQISIAVAQRYSILVTARNDTTSSNWMIHANMDTTMFDSVPDTLQPNITSSITYSSSASITDYGTVEAYLDINDTLLVPYEQISAPESTRTITLVAAFDTMDDGTNHAVFNDITYNSPLTPAILSEMTLGENATYAPAYGSTSFVLTYMDVIDIVIQNSDAGKHPFHIHGHKPFIVGRSIDYTSDDLSLNPPISSNQSNPLRRDTVHIPSGSSATLRFVADNPGVWFLHCHIEWHLEVGLAVQLVEAPLQAQLYADTVPQALKDNCLALGFPASGNAAGFASKTDLDGLPLGPYLQNNGWHPKGILAMFGCVLTAVIGMLTVMWYSVIGGQITEEETEHEVREAIDKKAKRGKFFGLIKPTS
ncbi:ferroxidase [Gymnopus androsaceus JB14]|uniref:Ferroxidase n=1 Tax=Gymnopus androsaceus JB14 TaxID=1447944 RepID=A0A6A4HNE1_9AGAR|nr:ferroxidase [Gymnopus androsaceus JB14]